jgi:hypothetical protein
VNERVDFVPFVWPGVARDLGFEPDSTGRVATRDDLVLRRDGTWLTLLEPGATAAADSAALWRDALPGEDAARAFDRPPVALDDEADLDSRGRPAFPELIAWAEATRGGRRPPGWTLPTDHVLDGIATTRLSVRASGCSAQGELIREPERLAVVFPQLVEIPDELPDPRRRWLDQLCCDTRARWKLVRVGVEPSNARVSAGVDLTGAPHACARALLLLSLEALACAIEWILPSLGLVVDTAAECRALEREPCPRSEIPTH